MAEPSAPVVSRRVCLLSVALYGISFVLPAAQAAGPVFNGLWGWQAFVLAFRCLAEVVLMAGQEVFGYSTNRPLPRLDLPTELFSATAWLANPLLWAGILLLMFGRRRPAGFAGLAAFLAGSAGIYGLRGPGPGAGFFFWWISMGVLALGGFWPYWPVSNQPGAIPEGG